MALRQWKFSTYHTYSTAQQEQAEDLTVLATVRYVAKEVGNDFCSSQEEGAPARSLEKSCSQQRGIIFIFHSVT